MRQGVVPLPFLLSYSARIVLHPTHPFPHHLDVPKILIDLISNLKLTSLSTTTKVLYTVYYTLSSPPVTVCKVSQDP